MGEINTGTDIGIVTRPSNDESYAKTVYRFTSIIGPISENLYLFAGGAVERDSPHPDRETISLGGGDYLGISWLDYLFLQFIVCRHILRLRNRLDLLYFQKGAMGLALPVFLARVIGIKTVVIKVGAFHNERTAGRSLTDALLGLAQYLAFRVAHGVVAFSDSEVKSVPNPNVFVTFSNYRDFEKFAIRVPFEERPFDIGFVSRFSKVKGINQVAEAAVSLVEENPEIKVRLVGSGPEYGGVEQRVAEYDRISLTSWVDHDKIGAEYNQIKVLVAPSKAEGLPTGLIEAMGCGTVILATPVGSVKDLIIPGETGFFLSDRSPEEIEKKFREIRNREDLPEIGEKARKHVVENYSKHSAQKNFERITQSLLGIDTSLMDLER